MHPEIQSEHSPSLQSCILLIQEAWGNGKGQARIMSEIAIVAASTKHTLLDIAKQAAALGTGLQNATPGERVNTPNNSVQYLLSIAGILEMLADECEKLT